jgi:hypothetical protein
MVTGFIILLGCVRTQYQHINIQGRDKNDKQRMG